VTAHPAILFDFLQRRWLDTTPFLYITATRVELASGWWIGRISDLAL
jgi:hypothetical protein